MVKTVIDPTKYKSKEPKLKPKFIEKMGGRQKEPTVKVKDFRKHFGMDEDASF